MRTNYSLVALLPIAPMLLASQTVSAQSAQDFDVITVTANRQSAPLMDVAGSLAVIQQQQLDTVEHQHINQILSRIAGTWVSRGNGQEHLTAVRSPVLTGAGGCGAFLMAEDGISLRAPGFCNTNQLFDSNSEQAQRIEVFRGPGSALYGSNAVHGIINVITQDPFTMPTVSLSLDVGPHDYTRGSFSASHQQQHSVQGVYANFTHDGGYKDESGFDQQKLTFVSRHKVEHWHNQSVLSFSNLNQETSGFITGFEAYKDETRKKENPNPEAYRDATSMRAYSRFTRYNDNGSQFSLTPYLRWNQMEFLQHFLPWQATEQNAHRSLGLQAQYIRDYDNWSLTSGFDLDYTDGELQEFQQQDFSPSIPQGDHYDYEVKAAVYAPYLQINWQPTAALTITGGIRYEHTDYDYRTLLTAGSACASGVDNCRFYRPASQDVTYSQWSPKLSALYKLNNVHQIYGQFATGYRAPQATELFRLQAGQQVAELDAEQMDSIELGLRGSQSNWFYDVAVFAMEKSNFIFQDSNRQNVSNGETQHRGVEAAFKVNLPANLYLHGNATYADHEYANNLQISRQDIKGNQIDTAPERMGSLQFGWQSEAGHRVELEWQSLGEYYLNPENTAEYAGHDLLNLHAAVQLSPSTRLNLRLLNLTDEDYAERADFGFGSYRYFVGEPRSVFASLRWTLD